MLKIVRMTADRAEKLANPLFRTDAVAKPTLDIEYVCGHLPSTWTARD